MREIVVKQRSLAILALVIITAVVIVYLKTPELLASQINKYEEIDSPKAVILKERLMKFFPGSEEARWEVLALVDQQLQREGRITIGPDFIGGGVGPDIIFSVEEVIGFLKKVAAAQDMEAWKYTCYERIAQLLELQGEYEGAEANYLIAAEGFEKDKKDHRAAEVNRSLINMYLEAGKFNKALLLVQESLQKYSNQMKGDFLVKQGDVYFGLGEYDQAERIYKEALEQAKKDWEDFKTHFKANRSDKAENINATLEDQPVYHHSKTKLDLIASLKDEDKGKSSSVKGQILTGDTSISNVLVYLVNEKTYEGRMGNFADISSNPPVLTDAQGKFEFRPVIPGKYFIVLGFKPEDLEGIGRFKGLETFKVEAGKPTELCYVLRPRVKVIEPAGKQTFNQGQEMKISWEEVPQASTYNLHITLKFDSGCYVSRVYRKNLKGNSYIFNPRGLELREMNFVARGDGFVLAPSAVLGSFYPGAEIFFVIEALDKDGRSISDSEGYVLQLNGNYPSIMVEEAEPLSAGDQYVIEKNYDEAVRAYQDALQNNPDDPYTLLSLARLYSSGWTEGTEDRDKAVYYYRKVLKVTNETFIMEEVASAAVAAGDYKLGISLFKQIEEQLEVDSFWSHLIGELYFKTGKPDKALAYYLKYLDSQKEFRDLGPVAAMLYQNDVNGAIKLLKTKDYSQKVRYNADGQTAEAADISTIVTNLEKYQDGTPSVLSQEDFKKYLIEIIKIDGPDRFEKVKTMQAKILIFGENDVLIQVLNELAIDRR